MVTVFVEILKSSVLLYLGFLNIRRYVLYLYIETLKQRLDAINQLRVDRALAAMGPAFQQVYSLLPTLLHYHHPLMPGYLDGNVPRGICLYTPDETQRHYLEELELHRGMQTQEPPKGDKLTIYKRKKQWKTTQNSDRFVILLFKTNNIFILKIYLSNSYK